MTQADYLISRFGGISAMARALNLTPSVVQGWKSRGHVPGPRLSAILEAGQLLSPPLDPIEFFPQAGSKVYRVTRKDAAA